jgi:hypothetical protein
MERPVGELIKRRIASRFEKACPKRKSPFSAAKQHPPAVTIFLDLELDCQSSLQVFFKG